MTAAQMYQKWILASGEEPWKATPWHALSTDRRQFFIDIENEIKEAIRQRDSHRASLNRIADRLHVVHEDPKIEDAVAALERERDELASKVEQPKKRKPFTGPVPRRR